MSRYSKCCRRQLHQVAHASRFRLRNLAPIGSDSVITAALVVKVWVGPVIGLLDQPKLQHPVDRSVKHAGTKFQPAGGTHGDLTLQGITMAFALPEGLKD